MYEVYEYEYDPWVRLRCATFATIEDVYDEYRSILDWCAANISSGWSHTSKRGKPYIKVLRFPSANDYMLFRLVWL